MTIEKFEASARELAIEFAYYMGYCDSENTWDSLNERDLPTTPFLPYLFADDYWNLCDMYTIIKDNIPSDIAHSWYSYITFECIEYPQAYLNINAYWHMKWKLLNEELCEKVVKDRAKNKAYWESQKGKAESKKYMDEKLEEFKKNYL